MRLVAQLAVTGFLAALAISAHECRSEDVGASPEGVPGSDVESSGWAYVDNGTGEPEWVVIGAEPGSSAAATGAATGEEVDAAQEGLTGWRYVDTGDGSIELVVDSSAEPVHGARGEADTSIDGDFDPDGGISDMEPSVVQGPRVPVIARPAVVTAGRMVHFTCEDPGMESLELSVMDISGRVVFSSPRQAGRDFSWDLRDDHGQPVPQGVYFYRAITHSAESGRHAAGLGRVVVLGRPVPSSY